MDFEPYSYRHDPSVRAFDDSRPIFFFDGVCILCSGFARYILTHDRHDKFFLCSVQSPLGQEIYKHYSLNAQEFETNLLLWNGVPYFKATAFIETMNLLGGASRLAIALRIAPSGLRDVFYDPIARNRYAWFGKRDSCYLPSPAEQAKFLS